MYNVGPYFKLYNCETFLCIYFFISKNDIVFMLPNTSNYCHPYTFPHYITLYSYLDIQVGRNVCMHRCDIQKMFFPKIHIFSIFVQLTYK